MLEAYLSECRELVLRELRDIIPSGRRCHSALYDLILEYPLRTSKGLRPALCIATCRSLGGALEPVLRSAAVLELYHNAFLIHDDVEDGSESRRDQPTLHRTHGAPIAVNVGDAMLALALQPLLDNMRLLGMGKALRIMQVVARMARESSEGQAMELQWIRDRQWRLGDADYIRMVYKKTSWYTFIAPMLIGGLVAGAPPEQLTMLRKFAALLGIAFQAQDDVLNLTSEGGKYGKESAGDLWEGKHTLILMHMMRAAPEPERLRAQGILSRSRPNQARGVDCGPALQGVAQLQTLLASLEATGDLTTAGRNAIEAAVVDNKEAVAAKTAADIHFLTTLIHRYGSIERARQVAHDFARKADCVLSRAHWLTPSVHRDVLHGLVSFVVDRNW